MVPVPLGEPRSGSRPADTAGRTPLCVPAPAPSRERGRQARWVVGAVGFASCVPGRRGERPLQPTGQDCVTAPTPPQSRSRACSPCLGGVPRALAEPRLAWRAPLTFPSSPSFFHHRSPSLFFDSTLLLGKASLLSSQLRSFLALAAAIRVFLPKASSVLGSPLLFLKTQKGLFSGSPP